MIWTVIQRTSDGKTATIEIEAATREKLFAELSRQGITVVRVSEGRLAKPSKQFNPQILKFTSVFLIIILTFISVAYLLSNNSKKKEEIPVKTNVKTTLPQSVKSPVKRMKQQAQPTANEDHNSLEWLKKNDRRYFVPTDAVRRANGRLYTKNGIRILETLPARTIRADEGQKKIFKHQAEKQIARLLHIEPGKFFIGNMHYNERFIKSLKESINEPTPIYEDDDDRTRVLKEEVNEIKAELKAKLDAGEDVIKLMRDAETELRTLSNLRQDVIKELVAARLNEDVGEEEYKKYIQTANEILKERGMRELSCPAFAEGQLKYIREVHKARQAAKAAKEAIKQPSNHKE